MMEQGNYNRQADFRVNVQAYDNRIFVSLPQNNDHTEFPSHTYVYDVRLGVWTYYNFGLPSDLAVYKTDHDHTGVGIVDTGQAYFSSPNDEIGLFRLEGNLGDDEWSGGDVAVSAYLETGWLPISEPGNRHRLRKFEVITNALSSGGWGVSLYRDFLNAETWQTDSWDPTNTGDLDAYHEQNSGVDIKEMFTWLKVYLEASDTADDYRLDGFQLTTSSRPFHRGVRPELNQDTGGGGGG
jgi:hypothetical protein